MPKLVKSVYDDQDELLAAGVITVLVCPFTALDVTRELLRTSWISACSEREPGCRGERKGK